jgi:hypothetical protein
VSHFSQVTRGYAAGGPSLAEKALFASVSGLTGSAVLCMFVYMKRTNLYLREDHLSKLKRLSEKTGAPVSEHVRRAIEEYLKKNK